VELNPDKQNDRLTQHKRFVLYGIHPNFCFAKTSFMLETLYDITWENVSNGTYRNSISQVRHPCGL